MYHNYFDKDALMFKMLHVALYKKSASMHIILKQTVSNILEAQRLVDVTLQDNDKNQQIGL